LTKFLHRADIPCYNVLYCGKKGVIYGEHGRCRGNHDGSIAGICGCTESDEQEKIGKRLKEWSWNLKLQAKELKDKTDNFKND